MSETRDLVYTLLIQLIAERYEVDGRSLTDQEAEDLLLRMDTEADYYGAVIR